MVNQYPLEYMYTTLVDLLADRDITPHDLAQAAYDNQKKYHIPYTERDFEGFTDHVLHNINVLNLAVTGLSIDNQANRGQFPEPLQTLLKEDAPAYSVDETLAMAIAGTYSPIGVTNYGDADCNKADIAKRLDNQEDKVNVFASDIVNGIVGAIAGYVINLLSGQVLN